MTIQEIQQKIDAWIMDYGVRYFDEKTNMLLLMEEVGELSRLMARKYGEQSYKTPISDEEAMQAISDEFGDVLFVLVCLANQMGLDIEEIMNKNMAKKTLRDKERHAKNTKLR
jgi:NTP pyrophosphatase (non-canonical NTP hydrolase)